MRLKRPRYPEVVGTATYYFIQAAHRATAIDHAIEIIRNHAVRTMAELAELFPVGDWVVESLIQGAWLREYHEWEKATKQYFEGQHLRSGRVKPDWRAKLPSFDRPSHVDRVQAQLVLFDATITRSIIDVLDMQRGLINAAIHEDEYFVTEQNYRALVQAVADFWNELTTQEEFIA